MRKLGYRLFILNYMEAKNTMMKLSKRTYILTAISIIIFIFFIGLYNFRKPIPTTIPKMYQQLTKTVYTDKKITINYPQIINYGDNDKQKSINKIIKSDALKVLDYYKDYTDEVTLDINYIIKINGGNFLSIQYSGIGYSKGAAHPNNLFYTRNILLDNGSKIRLKDLIKIDENFVGKFKHGTYKSQEVKSNKSLEEAAKTSVQQMTTADLINRFNNADSLENIGTENQSDTFSYLSKDSLGICVSISHAAGDYAVFEIKYDDILDYIKAREKAWIPFS